VFPIYAVVIGVVAGWALGGRLANLAHIELRWAPLALVGLVAQILLFSGPIASVVGSMGPWIYVASSALVLAVLLRNLAIPGLRIVAVGAISNLVAIVANGGGMPASPDALAALGKSVGEAYSNSIETASPVLPGLTDVYALPGWLPFANVFSIGDVIIGVGIAVTVCMGMLSAGAGGKRPHGHPWLVRMGHGSGAEPPIRSA